MTLYTKTAMKRLKRIEERPERVYLRLFVLTVDWVSDSDMFAVCCVAEHPIISIGDKHDLGKGKMFFTSLLTV